VVEVKAPSLPSYRLLVASIILALWVVFHLSDAFLGTSATTPFIDATCGAVVTWLFGWPILRQRGEDE
jgi:hypothetical protein